jgi:hypothetical protein
VTVTTNAFYVDDSGSEPNGIIFVMAGLLSSVEEWLKFSTEWTIAFGSTT